MSLTVTETTPELPWPRGVLALADDLTGAAEAALALRAPATVQLGPAVAHAPAPGRAVVVDLDSRQLPEEQAAEAVRLAVDPAPTGALLFKKVDSLLRGNLAAEAAAYAEGSAGVVIATALPAVGRTVRAGVVHLDGVPLHATRAWQAEGRPAPESVRAAFGELPTASVPLEVVRGDGLAQALAACFAQGLHPVCDGETEADLDAVAGAALELGAGVRLLGTGGLAGAVGRLIGAGAGGPGSRGAAMTAPREAPPAALRATQEPPTPRTAQETSPPRATQETPTPRAAQETSSPRASQEAPALRAAPKTPAPRSPETDHPLLVVVGTAEPSAAEQVALLIAEGAHHLPLTAGELLSGRRLDIPSTGVTVVRVVGLPVPAQARRLVAALAAAVSQAGHGGDLVLTGGETARRTLDALCVSRLSPVGQVHHGAVISRTPDGRTVVTRPGSYGGSDSLLRIVRALRPAARLAPTDPTGVTS